jgi:hypothetical protein
MVPSIDRVRSTPGALVLAACVVGAATLLIHAEPNGETAYLPGAWVELVGLTLTGLVLISRTDSPARPIAACVGFVLAAQLAGSAVYAFRRWEPIGGFGGGVANIVLVRVFAAAMALAMLIACSACLAALIREGAFHAPFPRQIRIFVVAVGVALVFGLPWVLGVGGTETTDLTSIGAYAILYSLPWGVALIGTAWLGKIPASATLATIALGAGIILTPSRSNVVDVRNTIAGLLIVLIAAGLVGLRILGERRRDASLLDSPGPTAPP